MSVGYGTAIVTGMILRGKEAKRIEQLYLDDIMTEEDWERYFCRINGWTSVEEDGLMFGLITLFDSGVCVVKAEDIFSTVEEIKEFEQEIENKPWFKEIKWEPQKYLVNYCY